MRDDDTRRINTSVSECLFPFIFTTLYTFESPSRPSFPIFSPHLCQQSCLAHHSNTLSHRSPLTVTVQPITPIHHRLKQTPQWSPFSGSYTSSLLCSQSSQARQHLTLARTRYRYANIIWPVSLRTGIWYFPRLRPCPCRSQTPKPSSLRGSTTLAKGKASDDSADERSLPWPQSRTPFLEASVVGVAVPSD